MRRIIAEAGTTLGIGFFIALTYAALKLAGFQ